MNMFDITMGFLVGLIVGLFMSVASYEQIGAETHKTIISHDCGSYNSTTGKFQWHLKEVSPQ